MKVVLERLWMLQQMDTEIRDLIKSREALSAGTKSAQAGVDAAQASVDAAHTTSQEALAAQHRCELELKSREAEINKAKVGLNKASTNAEYQSLLLKIGTLEAECGKIEEDILVAMDTHESYVEAEKTAQSALKDAAGVMKAAEARVEEQRGGLEATITASETARAETAEMVPAEQLRLYERIRGGNQSTGTAVAVVYGEYCQGCQMQITPQQHADLVGGTTMVLCRTCQRILSLGGE